MLDELTRAVLSRDEIAKYLAEAHGESGREARERIETYLEELRTTQRYSMYKALKHPFKVLLRNVERIGENLEAAKAATRGGRVVYVSNHRSHFDYLVEPLVLDDNDVRPPVIAAGVNVLGGPLGLLWRHVAGAMPIRRNSRDAVYLMTLKAYVAELLRKQDLFFFPEGGRSYSGELKPPKTGLLNAALQAEHPNLRILPAAVSYDLVIEDHVLARQRVKRGQRPFSREIAEIARFAVGYKSRAFVTFGAPISVDGVDPNSRSSVLAFARTIMKTVGRLYKVLPTAIVATAMRPSISRKDLEEQASILIDTLASVGANLDVTNGPQAVDAAIEPLEWRGIIVVENGRLRVRDRSVLRYYARSLDHLLESPSRRTH